MDIQTMENNIKGRIYFQYADFHDDLMRVYIIIIMNRFGIIV